MTIIYMSETDQVPAQALSQLDKSSIETVVQFDEVWPKNPAEITLLAHTDSERLTLGGRTPEELASGFAQKITSKKRGDLKDLYLISCEAGLAQGDTPSLADQLAHEMQKKGFLNLQIHAVRSPDDMQMAGMRVEVITQTGISGKPKGYVQAFASPTPYCHKLESLLEDINQRIEYLEQQPSSVSAKMNNVIQAELRQKRIDFTALNESMKKDPNYIKINLLSTLSYKDDMKKAQKTSATGNVKPISYMTLMTISYLQIEKLKIANDYPYKEQEKEKDIQLFNQHITVLEEKSPQSSDQVKKILNTRYSGFRFIPVERMNPLFDQFKKLNDLKKDTELSPEIQAIAARTDYCKQLTEYHELRSSNDWDYHYNFLNLVSLVYLVLDFCTGSDHFNSQKREVKLSAAEKMIRHINGDSIQIVRDEASSGNKSSSFFKNITPPSTNSDRVFTKSELNALQQGRLGKIVAEHGGIDALGYYPQQPQREFHQKLHDIVKKYRP